MVALLSALLLGSIALKVANPQIVRLFIDAAERKADVTELVLAGAVFLSFALVVQALTVAAVYVSERVGWTATNNLRADLALHCIRLDMAFHNAKTPGEMVERVDGDVMDLSIFFSQLVIQVAGSILLMITVIVALSIESWQAGLMIAAFSMAGAVTINKFRAMAVPFWKTAREAHAGLYGFLEEHLGGLEDIRSSGAATFTLRGLFENGRRVVRAETAAGVAGIYMWIVWCVWEVLGRAVAFIAAWALWNAGTMTLGGAFLLVYYMESMFTPLRMLVMEMEHLQKAAASIIRLREIFSIQSSIGSGGSAAPPDGPLGVTFDDVTFGYSAESPVLNGVSFCLRPGRVLGVLGRTGSGKTTLARLIFRLYDASTGTISLTNCHGAMGLREISLKALPSRVSMVTQDVQVFRTSIRNNLTLFDDSIPDSQLLEVIGELGLGDWFAKQPHGLDTEMESGGRNLSAGEAQLLAFGRVFLRNPGLIVMDEASSRLDPVTEARIEYAVDRLLNGEDRRSALIIAHRLATVLRADDILIIEQGTVAEYGPRAELQADQRSLFSRLLQTAEIQEVLA